MNIVKVKISNILGIENLEFEAGKFNVISGKNGQGKTSVLEALKSVFKSGNDATLIRNGASAGEVVLVLNDGTEIKKTFSDKATLSITDGNGDKISKPASYLEQISDLISINPVAFLTADKKERTNILLNALPLKCTEQDLRGIVGDFYPEIKGIGQLHALEAISQIHKVIYDERTAENRSIKQTSNTITELSGSLVHAQVDPSINLIDKIAELENVQSGMNQKLSEYYGQFTSKKNIDLSKNDDMRNDAFKDIDTQYEIELNLIREKRDIAKQTVLNRYNSSVEKINAEYIEQTTSKKMAFDEKFNLLVTELAHLRGILENQTAYNQQFEYINKLAKELETYEAKSLGLSNALDSLVNYKTELLKDLPISGLEIADGQIFRNGVLFDRLNTAQQVEIAVEIAKLKAGELGLICVDGIERLDTETFNRFKASAEESGLQLIVTAVSDTNLSIN